MKILQVNGNTGTLLDIMLASLLHGVRAQIFYLKIPIYLPICSPQYPSEQEHHHQRDGARRRNALWPRLALPEEDSVAHDKHEQYSGNFFHSPELPSD